MAIKRKKGDCSVEGCGAKNVYLGRVNPPECTKCYQYLKAKEYENRAREKEKNGGKKKRKPISPISNKKAQELKQYRKVRDEYMAAHKKCQVKGCNNDSNDLHHKAGRVGSLLSDVNYFMAVCRGCHNKIHENPIWAEQEEYIVRIR